MTGRTFTLRRLEYNPASGASIRTWRCFPCCPTIRLWRSSQYDHLLSEMIVDCIIFTGIDNYKLLIYVGVVGKIWVVKLRGVCMEKFIDHEYGGTWIEHHSDEPSVGERAASIGRLLTQLDQYIETCDDILLGDLGTEKSLLDIIGLKSKEQTKIYKFAMSELKKLTNERSNNNATK